MQNIDTDIGLERQTQREGWNKPPSRQRYFVKYFILLGHFIKNLSS